MRVLLISHTCQSRTEGQPKAELLGRMPDVDLRVLVPERWQHYGRWRAADPPTAASFQYEVQAARWPWLGPAQFYLHWYPQLAHLLREFQPDVIDLWEEPWGLVSAHACYLRNRLLPGAKIISETEQNIYKRLPPPFEQFRAYTLRHADMVVARNREAVEVVRAKGYGGPVEAVPNGVDARLFRPLDRDACRRELGLTGFVAGYVGRLVEEKGLLDMVEALPHCAPDAQLLFVGSGPCEDALRARTMELGVAERVLFLPAQPLTELPRIMNALDVLVLASHTTPRWKEQFGRVIIEAHACRTPVIGSDSGAIPEVIDRGGRVVPERNPAGLAAALRELHADPALRERLGAAGRRQVEERCTWDRVAAQMRSIYTQLTDEPRAAEVAAA